MKLILAIILIGYCCTCSEGVLLALKAKLLGYKAGKTVGIAAGLGKGALIGGIGGYGGVSNKVIRYVTNPIYSYDPRPLPGYGPGPGGYGHGHGHGGPIVKVLHKHLPHPPQIVNVYHHSQQHHGGGGAGYGYEHGHGIGGGEVRIIKILREEIPSHNGVGGGDYHHNIGYSGGEEHVIKVIQEDNHSFGGGSGHGWS